MTKSSAGHFGKNRLGDFEIVRELGRGGMGIVSEARQISLNRKVALKVHGTSLGMTSRAVIRFRREADAAAKLHHTNIVPIYATGEHDDPTWSPWPPVRDGNEAEDVSKPAALKESND